jgi:predicted HAD superfamily Cof-like phosphohydrolase
MRVEQEKVEYFHAAKLRQDKPPKPTLVPFETALGRFWRISQEVQEFIDANAEGDLVAVADAVGDMLYTVLGAAVEHGLDAQKIFDEVHRSNMTKDQLDPVTKKGGKGPNYQPPRIAEIIFNQSTGLVEENR